VLEDSEIEELREQMEAKKTQVAPELAEYVQATLEYGVESVRVEYGALAHRNHALISRALRRGGAILVLLVIAQIVLGLVSINLSAENGARVGEVRHLTNANRNAVMQIQTDRKQSIEERCTAEDKRHDEAKQGIEVIARTSKPARLTRPQAQAQQVLIDQFVNALAPHPDCKQVLHRAGF
jgi:hypothetical protein